MIIIIYLLTWGSGLVNIGVKYSDIYLISVRNVREKLEAHTETAAVTQKNT
jgi:hypothetical protein